MKVFLVDKYKVHIFSLPNKVEDSFSINYCSHNGIEEVITLTADNNEWVINGTEELGIYDKNSMRLNSDHIKNNSIYNLKFIDLNDTLTMYCFETPINFFSYWVDNRSAINVGSSANNEILFNDSIIPPILLKIYKYNGYWVLEDNNSDTSPVFLNNKRVNRAYLKIGDVIFSNGFKIIWMNDFIKINNPYDSVTTTLQKVIKDDNISEENLYSPVKDTEKNIVLYTENQTFFHTPRIKTNIIPKNIKISNPPMKKEDSGPPAFLTLGSTIMMGISSSITGVIAIFSFRDGDIVSAITQLIICGLMVGGTIVFPVLLAKYTKKKFIEDEKKRQEKYTQYLNTKKEDIAKEIKYQSTLLYANNLNLEQCIKNITTKTNIWNREIQDNDFLTVRLGVGNQKAQIDIEASLEDFSMVDDNLKDEVKKILNTPLILENVPITISFANNKIVPIIVDESYEYKQQFIDSILLQIMTYYSCVDLKIVILTNEENKDKWEYLKYTPYCCNSLQSRLFFATNEDEMKQLSIDLEEIYKERKKITETTLKNNDDKSKLYTSFDEYFLIITDDFIKSKRLDIIKNLLEDDINIGFSLITIESSMKNVPSNSNKFIYVSPSAGIISSKDLTSGEQASFTTEYLENSNIVYYSKIISNIPISYSKKSNALPTSLDFLEMYKVGKIEQLNILNRWGKNDPTVSLAAQVGVDEEGKPFILDLHEKYHGPHGLIAGSTGSGKSEFIITYILSMAINYDPKEVQFVLIDYKGGGLAGAFENRETGLKIPHLIGTITNLDTSEMNRTLVSIKSELQRRQILFNEARNQLGESTVDIYKYQKYYRQGLVKEPISHLFIISDEFAELKSQQPDFMNELVSTARIGRSLGVHLILATQKPSGVVDEQIWSNARFKVCLKVQTPEDSQELLKRPEAASIKETGRFYLQIGYDESFTLGQSAWSGARYVPTNKLVRNIDDDIRIVNNNGEIIKSINDNNKEQAIENNGDQLTNIVKTLNDIALKENIKTNNLWLPSISKEIFVTNLITKYNYQPQEYVINPIIGEYDIPSKQEQKLLTMDFSTGNLIIYGKTGSGKENLLQTLIYSTCIHHSPYEVNFYLLDFGSETLTLFKDYPQVGDIFLSNDINKVINLLNMLENEMNRRKELFAGYGGTYNSYIKTTGNKLPQIITVLNGIESFIENSDDYLDYLVSLLRDANKYGISFVVSATNINSIQSKVSQTFNNVIALQLNDSIDYKYYLHAPDNLVPAQYFGRGLISMDDTAYEFQTAYIYNPKEINEAIKYTNNALLSMNLPKARKVPIIPKVLTYDNILTEINSIEDVPIGIKYADGEIFKYNFIKNRISTILGNSIILDNKFTRCLISTLNSIPDIKIRIIDLCDSIRDIDSTIEYCNDNFTDAINFIKEDDSNTRCKNLYIFVGIGYLYDKVLDEGIEELNNIINSIYQYSNTYFLFIDNISTYIKLKNENWFNNNYYSNGIWVGNNIDKQDRYIINNLANSDIETRDKDTIYAIVDNNYYVLKGLSTEGDDYY